MEFKTERYKITVEEILDGGPGGYESDYLTREGDSATPELYDVLGTFQGKLLPVSNRNIRQRNGGALVEALRNNAPIGIASGFKPSGAYHFGHRLTSSAVAFFQKNGVQVFMPVADVECDMDTRLSKEQYRFWAADNLLDWGANGVNLDATHVYLQSEETRVNLLAYFVARSLKFDFATDIYGMEKMVKNFPFLFAGITQVGDIILPQHSDFGNHHSFMVSGQDQDGHMKMTVALTETSCENGIALLGVKTVPSGFYIPHIRGINGDKASSSKIEGTLFLGSGPQQEDLDERIKSTLRKFDNADSYHVKRCALDMVRFIDIFNRENSVDFRAIVEETKYKDLVRIRDAKRGNDILLEMDTEESKIINWLFGQYRVSELSKANTDEEGRELGAKIQGEEIRTRNQFLSQHRLDEYLIQLCEDAGQKNTEIVRDTLPTALREHQQKREAILEYAKARTSYSPQGGWSLDDDKPTQPEFWKVPERSVVDESKRNSTQWFNIVDAVADKIIP